MKELTAETITDEEIHALWREACGTSLATVNPDWMHLCTQAANLRGDFTQAEQADSRARCAEILNARSEAPFSNPDAPAAALSGPALRDPQGEESDRNVLAGVTGLTAYTITDDQIRELRDLAVRDQSLASWVIDSVCLRCWIVLNGEKFPPGEVRRIRQNCAELLNQYTKDRVHADR